MITIKNAKMLDGSVSDYTVNSHEDISLDAMSKLFLLPGVLDPHIYLNSLNREDWHHDLLFAIKAGITSLIECPQLSTSYKNLKNKKMTIDNYLADLQIPMDHFFYFRASPESIDELGSAKSLVKGIYLSGIDLLKENSPFEERVFQLAAWENLPVVVNLREEGALDLQSHSHSMQILEKSIFLAEKINARLLLLNVALEEELSLIQAAKNRVLLIYSETTPEILLSLSDNSHLWDAIKNNLVECVGSGYHSPSSYNIKSQQLPTHPSYLLPTLLTAYQEGKISLDSVVQATNYQAREIFEIKQSQDMVLVDLEKTASVPVYLNKTMEERTFKGYPVYTILKGRLFSHF